MPKIPTGDFGYRVAQPVPGARGSIGAFSSGLSGAGDGLMGLAAGELRRERAIEDQQAKESQAELARQVEQGRRNKAAASFAQYQVDLETFSTDLSTRLSEGQVTREAATKEYTEGLAKLKKQHVEGLDPQSKAELGDNLTRFDGTANLRFQDGLKKHALRERSAGFSGMIESLERLAATDRPGAVRQAEAAYAGEGSALFGKDVAAKQLQAFREKVAVNDWTSKLLGAKDNVRALNQFEADIQKDADLDPDKKTVLIGRAMGMKETLLARAERAAQSRERVIKAQVEARDRMILAGFTPSAEQDVAMLAAAKGTPYEPVVRAQVQFAAQTTRFAAMPPRQQETFLTEFEATIRKNPTPDGVKTLEAYQTIAKNQQQLVRDDPVSFAAQRGLATVQPIDFTQVATLKDQLLARVAVSRGMQGQYGAPLKVLTKEEAGQLSKFLKDGTADARTQLLGALKGAMPDQESYVATMQQIAPDSPVTAWAGSLMSRRPYVQENTIRANVETQATRVSQLMIRGESILNPSAGDKKQDGKGAAFKLPSDKDLRQGFEAQMGDAYRGREDAHSVAFQSAKAVYAALSTDEGDYSGELRPARWQMAVNLATGGATNFNGAKVVRPYGMREDDFKNAVYTEMGRLASSGRVGLTQQQLQRARLESHGDSQYLVVTGTDYLRDKQGRPVLIDLMQQSVAPTGYTDEQGKPLVTQIPK
jgi:hypothetical protein